MEITEFFKEGAVAVAPDPARPSDFNQYQAFTESLAVYNEDAWLHYTAPSKGIQTMSWAYPAFALAEEVGEVCGKIAKFIRKSKNECDPEALKQMVKLELGDVMYQLSETARQFDLTLQEVVDANYEKLIGRKERGTLVGDGDVR